MHSSTVNLSILNNLIFQHIHILTLDSMILKKTNIEFKKFITMSNILQFLFQFFDFIIKDVFSRPLGNDLNGWDGNDHRRLLGGQFYIGLGKFVRNHKFVCRSEHGFIDSVLQIASIILVLKMGILHEPVQHFLLMSRRVVLLGLQQSSW